MRCCRFDKIDFVRVELLHCPSHTTALTPIFICMFIVSAINRARLTTELC